MIIRVIDLEGNGTDPPAEIIEYGCCDLTPLPEQSGWHIGEPRSSLWGLTAPMDPVARSVHHIRPSDLEGRQLFSAHAAAQDAEDAGAIILAAHAWDLYEGKWFTPEVMGKLRPLCTYKAALRLWPEAPSHSNGALRYWLEDQGTISPFEEFCAPAHRAGPDAYVTACILAAQLERTTAREMVAWTKEPRLLPTCPIGKERGKKWPEVDGGFLQWMTRQETMEADLKWLAQRELDRRAADQRTA